MSHPDGSPAGPVLPLRVAGAVLAVFGLVPIANYLSAGKAVPWWPAAVAEWTVAGAGIILVALLASTLLEARAPDLIARAERLLCAPSSRVFEITIVVLTFGLAAAFAWYCFDGMPFSGDELAQRWHARILLSGHAFALPQTHREFFSATQVADAGGRWFSQFPIGGPAVIAVGVALGAPWLVNPLLAAFTAHQLYRFTARAFDETTARAAALLFVASPFVLIMSASEMNHVVTLALVMLALARLATWATSPDPRIVSRSAMVIGLALGAAAAVRPMDAALAAVAIGVFQLAAIREDASRRRSLWVQCLAGAVPVAILLAVNATTTGDPFLFAYDALNGPAHRPGFHTDPLGLPFTPLRGLIISSGYLMKLNRYLFEWPIPALVVIVAGLAAASRATRWDVLLLGLLGVVVAGYACYWFDGFFAGPRFLYAALPALLIFTARAPVAVAALVRRRFGWPIVQRTVLLLVPLCVAYAWLVPTGVSSVQLRAFYYRQQRMKLKADIPGQTTAAHLTNALVFVPVSWHSRIVARLRALDMRPLAAERLVGSVDACALWTALDAEDTLSAASSAQRLDRVVSKARAAGNAAPVPGAPPGEAIAIVPGSRPTVACLEEVARDAQGTMPFGLFLALQAVGRDQRVGGPVVFARDFGARDSLLRASFPDRVWYRYRPQRTVGDTLTAFVRMDPSPARVRMAPIARK